MLHNVQVTTIERLSLAAASFLDKAFASQTRTSQCVPADPVQARVLEDNSVFAFTASPGGGAGQPAPNILDNALPTTTSTPTRSTFNPWTRLRQAMSPTWSEGANTPTPRRPVTLAYGAIGAHTHPSVAVPRSAAPRVSAYASSVALMSAAAVPALPVLVPATTQDQPPVPAAPPVANVPVTTEAVPATDPPAGYLPPWHEPANPAEAGSAAPASAPATPMQAPPPASQAAFTTPFLQRRQDILDRLQAAQALCHVRTSAITTTIIFLGLGTTEAPHGDLEGWIQPFFSRTRGLP